MKESKMQYLDAISKTTEWSRFQGKPFNITVIQAYAPTSNTEEAEVERRPTRPFRTNTPKDTFFIIGDWNAKVGSQETPGVTGKFGLGIQNEAGQSLIELCQENALVIANSIFQQHNRRLYTWTWPDDQHQNHLCLDWFLKMRRNYRHDRKVRKCMSY